MTFNMLTTEKDSERGYSYESAYTIHAKGIDPKSCHLVQVRSKSTFYVHEWPDSDGRIMDMIGSNIADDIKNARWEDNPPESLEFTIRNPDGERHYGIATAEGWDFMAEPMQDA